MRRGTRGFRILHIVVVLAVAAGCISPDAGPDPTRNADGSLVVPEDPFDRPADPDRSWQVMRVLVETEGAYRVGLPVPVAQEADVQAWADEVHIDGTAEVTSGQERGRHVFWVEGDQTVVVTWTLAPPPGDDGPDDFLGGAWSTGPAVGSEDDLPFVVERGVGDVELVYRARSNLCGGTDDRTGYFDEHVDVVPLLEAHDETGMWCY